MSKRVTFVERVLSGEVLDPQEEILDEIDAWHEANGAGCTIFEWLGMSRDEYALYVERPKALNLIFFGRKHNVSLSDAARLVANDNSKTVSLAARGANQAEIMSIIKWLRDTGRI